jgi:hypothetical protein
MQEEVQLHAFLNSAKNESEWSASYTYNFMPVGGGVNLG